LTIDLTAAQFSIGLAKTQRGASEFQSIKKEALMHAMILGLATVFLALWPAAGSAQCPQCQGDFNGDNIVTIDELTVAVNNALNDCPAPLPRFVDNGDGTVTDTNTGLQWEKKDHFDDPADLVICPGGTTCANPHDADNRYTWSAEGTAPDGSAYTDFLAMLNSGNGFAGHTDWRLPTVDELQTLVDHARSDPSADPAFNMGCTPTCTLTTCSCTVRDYYWTATPVADLPTNTWTVNFNRGIVNYADDTTLPLYVRAVRGGK
jgi:hypothetical protein